MKEAMSSTMLDALKIARAHDNKVTRQPGGFWCGGDGRIFGTTTIQGLVMRGYMQYTGWKNGRRGSFPIEAALTEEAQILVEGK